MSSSITMPNPDIDYKPLPRQIDGAIFGPLDGIDEDDYFMDYHQYYYSVIFEKPLTFTLRECEIDDSSMSNQDIFKFTLGYEDDEYSLDIFRQFIEEKFAVSRDNISHDKFFQVNNGLDVTMFVKNTKLSDYIPEGSFKKGCHYYKNKYDIKFELKRISRGLPSGSSLEEMEWDIKVVNVKPVEVRCYDTGYWLNQMERELEMLRIAHAERHRK